MRTAAVLFLVSCLGCLGDPPGLRQEGSTAQGDDDSSTTDTEPLDTMVSETGDAAEDATVTPVDSCAGARIVFGRADDGVLAIGRLGLAGYVETRQSTVSPFVRLTGIAGPASANYGGVGLLLSNRTVKYAAFSPDGHLPSSLQTYVLPTSDPAWEVISGTDDGLVFSVSRATLSGALDDYGILGTSAPHRVQMFGPGSVAGSAHAGWTHLLRGATKNELIFYADETGDLARCTYAATDPISTCIYPARFNPVVGTYDLVAGIGNGRLVFYRKKTGDAVDVQVPVTTGGEAKILHSFNPGLRYTHLVGRPNGAALFYDAATGTGEIYRYDTHALTPVSGLLADATDLQPANDDGCAPP